jgi:hypothetical protein
VSQQPSSDVVEEREKLVDAAGLVLADHVPDESGFCSGCLRIWARWVPYTGCTQAHWALHILETHGAADATSPLTTVVR